MARLPSVTVPQEILELLQAEATARGAPIAVIIREYLERGLIAAGHTLPDGKVKWGGKRQPSPPT